MTRTPNEIIADSLARERAKPKDPEISFYKNPSDQSRPITASIRMPNGEMHAGDGTTQCEALLMACIHWAMHGETK